MKFMSPIGVKTRWYYCPKHRSMVSPIEFNDHQEMNRRIRDHRILKGCTELLRILKVEP